jgi:hypothetical protein
LTTMDDDDDLDDFEYGRWSRIWLSVLLVAALAYRLIFFIFRNIHFIRFNN